ncbi:META domain-containing protein [Microbacterium sp. JZ37]|uniref:META domain-containing protein n=1 Tax=Microbacterium sp. JZ37 TaxID=2654193 RepID=UPI002B498692|nr:META domain-containing protein [Microbacterium sp. JZ37]WRH18279.1 META domain-containing protein [Microbacterium sp. JZ37]
MVRKRITAAAAMMLAGFALAGCASNATSGEGVEDVNSVVGTWQSSEENEPYLTFSEDGKFQGNDGCNGIGGRYEQDGDTVTVTFAASTLRACPGVDTWLSKVKTITVGETTLEVFDKTGEPLGSLARES